MPVDSRWSAETSRRCRSARTRHAGRQCRCVVRVWRYGLPQPRQARELTPCNAWDSRSGLRLPISQPFASNPAHGGWQAGRRQISYYRPLPGAISTVKSSKHCAYVELNGHTSNGLLQVTEKGFDAQGLPTLSVYVMNFDGPEQIVDAAREPTRTSRWIAERRLEGVNRVKREETTMMEYALAADARA